MNKLTITYLAESHENDETTLVVELKYNDERPVICAYTYNTAWCGWEWIDGYSEPNMSKKLRDFWHGEGGDKVIDCIIDYHGKMTIEL